MNSSKKWIVIFSTLSIAFLLSSSSCNKEAKIELPPKKVQNESVLNAVDAKIKMLKKKYDINFEYKWDRGVFPLHSHVDPMEVRDFEISLDLFEELYIKSVVEVQDNNKNFLKYESPLNMLFIGSSIGYEGGEEERNRSGGVMGLMFDSRLVVGMPVDFKKLVNEPNKEFLDAIFGGELLSNTDLKDRFTVSIGGILSYFFHEFTHFVNFKTEVPSKFSEISKKHYVKNPHDYHKYTFEEARAKGFVMKYGMINPSEDFATYVQVILAESDEAFKKLILVNKLTKAKYKIVIDFFNYLGLDLRKLRDRMRSPATKSKLLKIKKKYME